MIAPPPIRDDFGSLSWQTWFQGVYQELRAPSSGPTTARPTKNLFPGLFYFDSTLGKPIWYSGSAWVDATGASV